MAGSARKLAAPPAFEAVRRVRRYEQVAEQIRKLIASGAFRPGDKLPSERELVALLGVGRSSIRDAVRTLEVMGILEPRQGHGTVVRDFTADALVIPLASVISRKRELVSELLDVRRMIEPALAARAARKGTAQEIAHLAEILRRQEQKLREGEHGIEEDREFHYAIALAAHNTVVLRVLDALMDLLRDSRAQSLQVKGRPQQSFAGHRRILKAIERRDAKAAEEAVRKHLGEIERIVLRQL